MTIEELLIENQEILHRMKNEEWDTEKFIRELKGETSNEQKTEAKTQDLGRSVPSTAERVPAGLLCDTCNSRQAIQETEV